MSFAKFAKVAAVLALGFVGTAHAAGEVKLAFVKSYNNYGGSGRCPSCYDISGEIEVQNLAYAKQVIVHYNLGNGQWLAQNATYDTQIGNNKETWDFSIQTPFTDSTTPYFQMYLEYKVNGVTYYDNNNSANYRFAPDTGGAYASAILNTVNLAPSNVKLIYGAFQGNVVLKNLGYSKQVKLVYSTDGWATVNEGFASFLATDTTAVDIWRFNLTVPSTSTQVQYAIAYTVNGVTYWDNNHGRNYSVNNSSF